MEIVVLVGLRDARVHVLIDVEGSIYSTVAIRSHSTGGEGGGEAGDFWNCGNLHLTCEG